ncbi:MAG: hypothetical protein KF767_09040 [Bdellovibrionaceae bacterium]|nr:hypothetical protein [Pseudobdellovibrionaceae bacterium]
MSKYIWLRLLALCGFSLIVFTFQNCAPVLVVGLNEGEVELASQQGTVTPPELLKTTFEPVLMDRYVLRTFLADVFGPSVETLPSFALTVNAIEYGSPCSMYENYLYEVSAGRAASANANEICSLGVANYTSALTNPKASVTRQAELPRICSDIVHNDGTYNAAIAKLTDRGTALPDVNNATLTTAFHLFYREKPAPQESLLDALKLLSTSGARVSKADWQNVLYTICASGHWQVL